MSLKVSISLCSKESQWDLGADLLCAILSLTSESGDTVSLTTYNEWILERWEEASASPTRSPGD